MKSLNTLMFKNKGYMTKKEIIIANILHYLGGEIDQNQLMKLNIKTLKIIEETAERVKRLYDCYIKINK
tara:strand:- start:877 stop:1083 length:207 start_codon:yes stop_codon:yes gene_type:complete